MSGHTATESPNLQLGRRIKQERLRRGMTLKDIESRFGISATHVSEIERGRTSPTVGALSKIASALETKMSLLVEIQPEPSGILATPKDRSGYQLKFGAIVVDSLFPFQAGPRISLLQLTIPPGEKDSGFLRWAAGEVFLYVSKGILEVALGDVRSVIRDGDSLHFSAKPNHTLENLGESPARVIAVVSPRLAF